MMLSAAEFYLEDLRSKFAKINPADYYLSYSGGRDSHLLYWFIKEYLKEDRIEIVSMNTQMEIPEIRRRMLANSDRVLSPTKKHAEIKEVYGIPCFTKQQDELIYKYRRQAARGKITPYIDYLVVNAKTADSFYKLSNFAYDALFSGNLHKLSHLCCKYLKKEPPRLFEKDSGKKPIIGIMGAESRTRKTHITSCFNKKKYFYPIWDLEPLVQEEIEKQYGIEVPNIYKFVNQTGCAGCPYGFHGGDINAELNIIPSNQRRFVMDYFRESYEVRGFKLQYQFEFEKLPA